ncbi:DUF421 domain-containing protein [Chitinophagaceae bacterium MMS25-I14]
MNAIETFFGTGKDLNELQMSCRAVVVFIIALLLIRIAGRRSFGIKTAFDNIIVILLGAVLSRAVIGASPFVPTVVAGLVISVLHRCCGWLSIHHKKFDRLMNGEPMILYKDGHINKENMDRSLINEKDLVEGVRSTALFDSLEKAEAIYMERNGQISVVKKNE